MLAVIPIVEGHGEQKCVRILLQRIGYELLGGAHIEVMRPIRIPRSKLTQHEDLERAVELAARKCTVAERRDALILIMFDADKDAACELGPIILEWAKKRRADFEIACQLIVVEYETWFVGGAESLHDYLEVDEPVSDKPEEGRLGKGWVRARFRGASYSETVDQPAMTAALDLAVVKQRCPSFERLCTILQRHLEI